MHLLNDAPAPAADGNALAAIVEDSSDDGARAVLREPCSELRVPTAEELPTWMALVVRHHGASAAVAQLLKVCPAEIMQDACDLAWGVRSDDQAEQLARVRLRSMNALLSNRQPTLHCLLDCRTCGPPRAW